MKIPRELTKSQKIRIALGCVIVVILLALIVAKFTDWRVEKIVKDMPPTQSGKFYQNLTYGLDYMSAESSQNYPRYERQSLQNFLIQLGSTNQSSEMDNYINFVKSMENANNIWMVCFFLSCATIISWAYDWKRGGYKLTLSLLIISLVSFITLITFFYLLFPIGTPYLSTFIGIDGETTWGPGIGWFSVIVSAILSVVGIILVFPLRQSNKAVSTNGTISPKLVV